MAAGSLLLTLSTTEVAAHEVSIRRLITECFGVPDDEGPILEHLVGFHDPAAVRWMLLFESGPPGVLIGLVTIAPYTRAAHVANVCVDPRFRKRGTAPCSWF